MARCKPTSIREDRKSSPYPVYPAGDPLDARRRTLGVDEGDLQGCRSGKLKAVRLNQRGDIRTTREWVGAWMEQKQREEHVM